MAENDPTPAGSGGALTAEQIAKLVADSVAAAVRPLHEAIGQQQRALGAASVRDRYLLEKMADVPEAYRRSMPATDDAHALATEETKIRQAFRADLARLGFKSPDVGGAPPTAATGNQPLAALGGVNASPTEHIAAGLNARGGPGGAGAAPTSGNMEQQRAADVARAGGAGAIGAQKNRPCRTRPRGRATPTAPGGSRSARPRRSFTACGTTSSSTRASASPTTPRAPRRAGSWGTR
jgi:hypothetical protein